MHTNEMRKLDFWIFSDREVTSLALASFSTLTNKSILLLRGGEFPGSCFGRRNNRTPFELIFGSFFNQVFKMDVFHDPAFQTHLERAIRGQKWRVADPNLLLDTLEADSRSQPLQVSARLKRRRVQLMPWLKHEDRWGELVLGATSGESPNRGVLRSLGVLEVVDDFVDHLKCFYAVADSMRQMGHVVVPVEADNVLEGHYLDGVHETTQSYTGAVHDIDKLDPVMLAGYAERFTDGACTSLWTACVEGHVRRNAHHQGHALWQSDVVVTQGDVRMGALREMLCDKVSRHVQKDLGFVLCADMWDVDQVFFEGLPGVWMDTVSRMVKVVKGTYEGSHPHPTDV